jgi:hypothetical protein
MLFKEGSHINLSSELRHNYSYGDFKFFREYAAQEIKERSDDHVKVSKTLKHSYDHSKFHSYFCGAIVRHYVNIQLDTNAALKNLCSVL